LPGKVSRAWKRGQPRGWGEQMEKGNSKRNPGRIASYRRAPKQRSRLENASFTPKDVDKLDTFAGRTMTGSGLER